MGDCYKWKNIPSTMTTKAIGRATAAAIRARVVNNVYNEMENNTPGGHQGNLANGRHQGNLANGRHQGNLVNGRHQQDFVNGRRQQDFVNNGADDRITQLRQLSETLNEGLWGGVGFLHSLSKGLCGLLMRRETLWVLGALLSVVGVVILYYHTPMPRKGGQRSQAVPTLAMSKIVIQFVQLESYQIKLIELDNIWIGVHVELVSIQAYKQGIESTKNFSMKDAKAIAVKNRQQVETWRVEFTDSAQRYCVEFVKKKSNEIQAYGNSFVTTEQFKNTIGPMEFDVDNTHELIDTFDYFLPSMYNGNRKNTFLDWGMTVLLGLYSVFIVTMMTWHICQGNNVATLICLLGATFTCAWFTVLVNPTVAGYIDWLFPAPTKLFETNLLELVEVNIVKGLIDNFEKGATQSLLDAAKNGAEFVIALKLTKTQNQVLQAYHKVTNNWNKIDGVLGNKKRTACDCGDYEDNLLEVLETSYIPEFVTDIALKTTHKADRATWTLPYKMKNAHVGTDKGCTDENTIVCLVRYVSALKTHADVLGTLCHAITEIMSFKGVQSYLKDKSDERGTNTERYAMTRFLSEMRRSCRIITKALRYQSEMPEDKVDLSLAVVANLLRDGSVHVSDYYEGRKAAAERRMTLGEEQVIASCSEQAEEMTAVYYASRFDDLDSPTEDTSTSSTKLVKGRKAH